MKLEGFTVVDTIKDGKPKQFKMIYYSDVPTSYEKSTYGRKTGHEFVPFDTLLRPDMIGKDFKLIYGKNYRDGRAYVVGMEFAK